MIDLSLIDSAFRSVLSGIDSLESYVGLIPSEVSQLSGAMATVNTTMGDQGSSYSRVFPVSIEVRLVAESEAVLGVVRNAVMERLFNWKYNDNRIIIGDVIVSSVGIVFNDGALTLPSVIISYGAAVKFKV